MPPSKIGSEAEEAIYTGLYTFIVTVVALSPQGVISEGKLLSCLERVFLKTQTPLDKTSAFLITMIKHGYITKSVEKSPDQEDNVEFRVGPRGKVEIGNKGIQGMVREVYANDAPDDLDARLRRSLGIETAEDMDVDGEEEVQEQSQVDLEPEPSRRSSGRRR